MLAAAVITAWLTSEDDNPLHIWSGYVVGSWVIFRIIWGIAGPQHARFSDFVRSPRAALDYLKSLYQGHPQSYTGHNPAGGLMTLTLLGLLGIQVALGLIMLAHHGEGILADTAIAELYSHDLKEGHEFIGNAMLLLIACHLAGVAISSWRHRENLVKAMITGRKSS
ncbi:hypothetical protein BFW38_13265 [Terasakiispira papahanaumokuakeensis]|uniref:Cytochrome b561 bacterial/Ni-hydrogenase domain-containing protein n=1 Tax=Terasakiispira papahanaumokuakeensis TaxID=197479 RepID=A0A1E2VBK7_9GAMM|nr:hypothetical protein BFW38_13265 [Terasakiispira papahanaumokuakeensis]